MEIEEFKEKFKKQMKESKHVHVILDNNAVIVADDYMRDENLVYFYVRYVHYFFSGGSISGSALSGICKTEQIKRLKSVDR